MKGKILGFTPSAGAGAISGDTGERFSFVAAQWRSEKPITVGTTVDFAPMAGVATEIYPAAAALPAAADLAASPTVQKARSLAMTTLAFPLAVLLLLATFLPAISGTTIDPRFPAQSASLWGLGGLSRIVSANPMLAKDDVMTARKQLLTLDEREADVRAHSTGFGGMPMDIGPELKSIAEQREEAQKRVSAAGFASTVKSLLVVRWATPILALALLWFCWVGREVKPLSLATGGASLATALIIYGYRETIVRGDGVEGSIGDAIARQMEAAIVLGWGTYLIGLIGIGLILAGLGIVKNPLAAKA